MRDASIGLVACDQLAGAPWPASVRVDDLGYGAIYASQDIASFAPDRLILLAGVARGREPARVYRSRWQPSAVADEELQEMIREAGAGIIELDHLLAIGQHFGSLPAHTLLLEVEPVEASGGDGLSPACSDLLPELLALARREALLPPAGVAVSPVPGLPPVAGGLLAPIAGPAEVASGAGSVGCALAGDILTPVAEPGEAGPDGMGSLHAAWSAYAAGSNA